VLPAFFTLEEEMCGDFEQGTIFRAIKLSLRATRAWTFTPRPSRLDRIDALTGAYDQEETTLPPPKLSHEYWEVEEIQ
jgi:hypothetical protein